MQWKRPALVSRYDLFESLFVLLVLPGLFGFAFGRPIGPHALWQVLVVVLVVLSLYSLFSPKMKQLAAKGWGPLIAAVVVSAVIGGPGLYALVVYAYFSPRIWH